MIEYAAKNYSTYSRAGIDGSYNKIDNYDFDYHLKIGDNRDMGIVGKLKQVGAHSINYNKNYTSYVGAGITGKIESLGEQNLSITKMTVIQKWLVIQEIIQSWISCD